MRGCGRAFAGEPLVAKVCEGDFRLLAAERPVFLRRLPGSLLAVRNGSKAAADCLFGDGFVVAWLIECLGVKVGRKKLNSTGTILANVREQGKWIVGRNAEFSPQGSPQVIVVGNKAEKVRPDNFVAVFLIGQGHGEGKGCSLVCG